MKINKNREEITLEETLAYLKYLNREKPFNKEEVVIPTKDYDELMLENRQKIPTPKEKTKKIKMQIPDDENTAKSVNKNRAIKRIIESSFQILQKFNNYEQDQGQQKGDKSSEIQFNIYLKQYNRVLEMIYKKEKDMINRQAEKAEDREEILQNIYQYIVVQDFRQILPTAILKDKISKTNVEIMISALAQNLVILKTNELRIYESKMATGNFKSIKLHEIQNVDYHTQPYVFIVLSIQKDKQRFNVYLKFESEKNQQKWDRALYCCFIGRKMKTKEKFFLIEYPEEDVKKKQKEETKKIAAFNYDSDLNKNPLDKIFSEKRALSISDRSREELSNENEENLSNNQRGRKTSNVNSIKMNKNRSNMSKQDLAQRSIHNNKQQKQISDFGNKGTLKSIKFTGNDTQSNRAFDLQRKTPSAKPEDLMNRNKTDNINIKSGKIINQNEQDYTERNIVKPFPFGSTSLIDENKINDELNQQISQPKQEPLPADIRRIHDLQRKYVKGIVLEKEKFFFNKAKIIYLKENTVDKDKKQTHVKDDIRSEYQSMKSRQLQYWDFDTNNGQKTARKQIKITKVSKYTIKQQKSLVLQHQNKKQIGFVCDWETLKQIYQWIDLLQNIYKTKFQNI